MEDLKWCLKMKNGIELVEPSRDISDSYLKMAEESLRMIKNVSESSIWTASISYYTIYYSLYSVMMRIGIKCEIHKCSIEFMKQFLFEFYDRNDFNLADSSLNYRKDMQYYPGSLIDSKKLEFVRGGASNFLVKTKDILMRINDKKIGEIRNKIKTLIN